MREERRMCIILISYGRKEQGGLHHHKVQNVFHIYGAKINESVSKHLKEYCAQSNIGGGELEMLKQTHGKLKQNILYGKW